MPAVVVVFDMGSLCTRLPFVPDPSPCPGASAVPVVDSNVGENKNDWGEGANVA